MHFKFYTIDQHKVKHISEVEVEGYIFFIF